MKKNQIAMIGALALFLSINQNALSDTEKANIERIVEQIKQGQLSDAQLAALIPAEYAGTIEAMAAEISRISKLLKDKKYKRAEHGKLLENASMNIFRFFKSIEKSDPAAHRRLRLRIQTMLIKNDTMVLDESEEGETITRSNDELFNELEELGVIDGFDSSEMTICF